MATRRRIGVRIATTEAARRQLMQPVVRWEKIWDTPENAASGSGMKIYKWVKTDKKQQFSDDEEEADEPLAPLPDEPEVVEGDEDMDQDEPAVVALDATHDVTVTNFINQDAPSEPQTKPPSPTPPTLSLQQTEPILTVDESADMLDATFKTLDGSINVDVESANAADVGELDMSVLGPDGTAYDGVHDLSQLDGANALLGGSLMDDAGDPFAPALEHQPPDQEATG
ncbi:hypothetical protein JVU11DRAFT_4986 [Chiua virens]|nr:hypothetical protein JVU11DRAFT_4986 [Chiua virens]